MRFAYLHTLDGKPATVGWNGAPYLYKVHGLGGSRAKLVPTLKQLKREQRECQRSCRGQGYFNVPDLADPKRYGFVRVLLPDGD